ncbi:methyl-accepting chemotaxis protein [Belnapia rosea]|uniref:Methyl-accepting chemotaxis sensory transducer with Pas/Pac sensor n=1 Tax=Belnapia rosea TaxID=938405 RepID=A0A1G6JEU1_9PROT|nr:PAS domain-containing methyl-accepting chemotaxis protein [Belnapia rosea]SDB11524.1 methyl-accepting chemotaxis sensory transducer with Pas/Pac sensor [Belnapia rosea]SDC17220.1 methyl-accepting chemotaxis sensory transducer with Pas/Pac sensor [Belnapia rosea]
MHNPFRKPQGLNTRIAALDPLRTSVMVADQNRMIVYMNHSAMAMVREAEEDLRKQLQNFRADALIGSAIDAFHPDPSQQRRRLETMRAPHEETIRLGDRVLDLRTTPLFEGKARIGFVVEWADARDRLAGLDHAAQMMAVSRSQAVIEFNPDGTILDANDNFLKAMGYTLEEVRGRHHTIFVEPALRDSPDYARFWEALQRGEYQAAQFRRLGKGGREVWIDGAYNPILDTKGKVTKVVKFATDITAQIHLLANLKLLIDRNFAEIDRAIERSTTGAETAAVAAGHTAEDVQSAAGGIEQLAASIGEISESMARSRNATECASEQTTTLARTTDSLAQGAQAMGGIVGLIRNIASQINLLALNATIEAARAGEAGKGFAVVASEVKNLAVQAAKATEQISTEIDGIQATSTNVAGALEAIRDAVSTVLDSVTLTAAAVEEQNAVTRSLAEAMRNASGTVSTVSTNIGGIADAVREAGEAVHKTREAAQVLVR